MGRNATVVIGWCFCVAGGGLFYHGIFLPSVALMVASIAAFMDAGTRID